MYNQDVKGAFGVEITRDNITLKPRALHMAVGIAIVAEGIFVVVMVLRFRMSAINISEFFRSACIFGCSDNFGYV